MCKGTHTHTHTRDHTHLFEDIDKLARHKGLERPRSQIREESSKVSPVFSITYSPQKASPDGSDGQESTCNAGDRDTIPGSRRSPGVWLPLQNSCLENSMDREAWWATVHGVTRSRTQLKWLSTHARRYNRITLLYS